MNQKQNTEETSDFAQKKKMLEGLAVYPALMIMIFIRRGLGFRLLKPLWLTMISIGLFVLWGIYPDLAKPYPLLLAAFAIATLVLGRLQRYWRWCDICAGVRWHTYSPGISYLEKIPWPQFWQRNRRIYRFLDPVLCLLLSIIASFFSRLLGSIIGFGGIGLIIYENALFERMITAKLDVLDGMLEADIQTEHVKHFEGPQPDEKQRSLADTGGIPTGIAPDLDRQVAIRRAKRLAAMDNLAKPDESDPAR